MAANLKNDSFLLVSCSSLDKAFTKCASNSKKRYQVRAHFFRMHLAKCTSDVMRGAGERERERDGERDRERERKRERQRERERDIYIYIYVHIDMHRHSSTVMS